MKSGVVFPVTLVLCLLACQNSVSNSVETNANEQTTVHKEYTQIVETEDEVVWTPTAIQDCISKVNVGEPFKLGTFINPFYLRADLDGNKFVDYAVIIQGQNTKKNGVVICKDSKEPFVFGALSKSEFLLSSFEDDNFITHRWVISTKEFTKKQFDPLGQKISPDAKGESIKFIFEGGNGVNIYWDGKTFRIGE